MKGRRIRRGNPWRRPFRIYDLGGLHMIVGTAHIPDWPGAAVPEVTADIRGFHIEATSSSPLHGFAELPLVITKDASLTAVTANASVPTNLSNQIGFATNNYSGENRAFRQRTPSHQNWWLNPLKGHRHSVAYDGNVDLAVGLSCAAARPYLGISAPAGRPFDGCRSFAVRASSSR